MDRVGSTCTTFRSFFVFKAIFTFLADYAKMMVVCIYSSEFWPMAIYINLIYGILARMGSTYMYYPSYFLIFGDYFKILEFG